MCKHFLFDKMPIDSFISEVEANMQYVSAGPINGRTETVTASLFEKEGLLLRKLFILVYLVCDHFVSWCTKFAGLAKLGKRVLI